MKSLHCLTAASLALIAACGADEAEQAEQASGPAGKMDHSTMDHGAMDQRAMDQGAMADDSMALIGGMAPATGTIIEIEEGGDYALIDHGPIPGIGMEPMAMRFGTLGDVDFGAYEQGDEVSFAVKVGRDGTARAGAICKPAADGADCLRDLLE